MNYNPTWTSKMNLRYSDITFVEQYPMTEYYLKKKSVIAADLSQQYINDSRFYADEQIYPQTL